MTLPLLAAGGSVSEVGWLESAENTASVSASVMAATTDGGTLDLSDSDGPVQCPGVDISTKCLSATLNEDQTGFVYQYEWTVSNSGAETVYDLEVSAAGEQTILPELAAGASESHQGSFESIENPASVSASIMAASTDGGTLNLSASDGPAQCPSIALEPGISVTSSCSTILEPMDGKLVVAIKHTHDVCNTSPEGPAGIDLTDVQVTDTATNAIVATLDHLAPGACQQLESPTTYPSVFDPQSEFTNTFEATGSAGLDLGLVTSGPALTNTCGLCL